MLTPHCKCHQLLNYWTTCWTHCNNAKVHWHHNLKFTFLVMVLAKGHSPPLGFLILNWHWQCCEAHWWTAWRSVETMLNRIDQPWPIQSNVDSGLSKEMWTVDSPKPGLRCSCAQLTAAGSTGVKLHLKLARSCTVQHWRCTVQHCASPLAPPLLRSSTLHLAHCCAKFLCYLGREI